MKGVGSPRSHDSHFKVGTRLKWAFVCVILYCRANECSAAHQPSVLDRYMAS